MNYVAVVRDAFAQLPYNFLFFCLGDSNLDSGGSVMMCFGMVQSRLEFVAVVGFKGGGMGNCEV